MNIEIYEYQGNGIFFPPIDITKYLYEAIKKYGPITRNELMKKTNIPRSTIFDHVITLDRLDQVDIEIVNNHQKGRPKVYYRVNNGEKKET